MVYVFDDCELDTQRITLRRAGQTLSLRPKVFQVLLYLLTHREHVVDKQELSAQVWPAQFISDATLESTVRAVRQAVGDSGKAQRIIQTLYGHGYRFVVPVTTPTVTPEDDAAPGRPDASEPAEPVQRPASPPQTDQPPVLQLDPTPHADTPAPGPRAPEAERRQLTVMFCDLADSTTLAGQLDPEDLYDVIRAYQAACASIIERFEGHIAQYLGDGLLVYFGYPLAHEDDARRAVQAGLGIVDALGPLKTRLAQEQGVHLAVRIGIHTGLVVVGAIGTGARQEHLALGETPNLASRLQGLAAPDTLVISAATARLVQGFFVCQPLQEQTLRGIGQPVTLYRVLGTTGAQSRLDVVGPRGFTPLVGRQTEVALLLERWVQVKEGVGQVVVLSGEAGIGKSRLARVLQEHLAEEAVTLLECRCSSYHQHSAWYPVIELLQRVLRWQPDETAEGQWRKLETVLEQYGLRRDETAPLLATLLSLPGIEARYAPRPLTPEQQRRKTLEAILALVLALAARQPVLCLVDDLHWVDPSTLEILTLLVEQTPTVPLYLVLTCRPTFPVPWGSRSYLTQITLPRLQRAQVERMVTSLTGGKALPPEVLRRVVEGTDGVPLFVEELTKAVLETGVLRDAEGHYEVSAPLPTLAIPTTLHDSLMARLDRLGAAKSVAQLGATVGRRFSYALLHAVAQRDDLHLQQELGQLVEAEMVYQHGVPPQATYIFKHALIQEAAYQSLVRHTRQSYHQRIAQTLAAQFTEIAEPQPELLAYHYTEAGLLAPAVDYWLRAGQRAVERSANVEAISHFTKGLEVLKILPDTPERRQQELALQLALGAPLLMIKGYTAPEVEQVYTRVQELCQQVGDSPQRFSALAGLWRFYLGQVRFQTTRELAEQAFVLAQRLQDPSLLQEAHVMLGSTLFYVGELSAARAYLEQGMSLYDAQQGHSLAPSRTTNPGVACLAHASWVLWMLGYPDQAGRRSREACALARLLSQPYNVVFALTWATALSMFRREARRVQEQAEATIALAREHAFVRWLSVGMAWRGWALAEQGAVQEGITQICQAMAMRGELGLSQMPLRLAEMYGKAGQAEDGLRVLAEAFAVGSQSGERRFAAEFYRLQGELLLQSAGRSLESGAFPPSASRHAHVVEAETRFRQAIDVARSQQARSLELRATMSLSRLWQQQGKGPEARVMLEAIYSWFTEGFDTLDLQEAKALLEALQ